MSLAATCRAVVTTFCIPALLPTIPSNPADSITCACRIWFSFCSAAFSAARFTWARK
jgi:hypothetical protein